MEGFDQDAALAEPWMFQEAHLAEPASTQSASGIRRNRISMKLLNGKNGNRAALAVDFFILSTLR